MDWKPGVVDCLVRCSLLHSDRRNIRGAVEVVFRRRGEAPSAAPPGQHGSCARGHDGPPRPADPRRHHDRNRAVGSHGGEPFDRASQARLSARARPGPVHRRAPPPIAAVQRAVWSRGRPRVRRGHDPARDRGPGRRDAGCDRGQDAARGGPRADPLLDERPDPLPALDGGCGARPRSARRHRWPAGSRGPRAGNGRGPHARLPELGERGAGGVPREAGRSPRGRGERRPAGRARRALAGCGPGSRHLRLHLPGSGHRRRDPRRGRAAPWPPLPGGRDRGHVHGVRVPGPGLRNPRLPGDPRGIRQGSYAAGNRTRAAT